MTGHPLYTFAGDKVPGQDKGNGVTGFGGRWYAMTVSGKTLTTSSSTSSGGYG
jgi:hypothetical protein